jgi:hypothetical protein
VGEQQVDERLPDLRDELLCGHGGKSDVVSCRILFHPVSYGYFWDAIKQVVEKTCHNIAHGVYNSYFVVGIFYRLFLLL